LAEQKVLQRVVPKVVMMAALMVGCSVS
jgi:hypothetical protein